MQQSLQLTRVARPLQRQLLRNTATEGMFPRAQILLDDQEFVDALKFVGARKNHQKYRCAMDFLFCEMVLDPKGEPYRVRCFDYYYGRGPALISRPESTAEQIVLWDALLVRTLLEAREYHQARRSTPWTKFRQDVRNKHNA